jgi:hypothetical protein
MAKQWSTGASVVSRTKDTIQHVSQLAKGSGDGNIPEQRQNKIINRVGSHPGGGKTRTCTKRYSHQYWRLDD